MNLEELIFLSYGKQKSIREGKVVIGDYTILELHQNITFPLQIF